MGKIIFILGGARSGKSRFALELAKKHSKSILFVATAIAFDKEMRKKIKEHRRNRPYHWKTAEIHKNLPSFLKKVPKKIGLVIIDCVTIYMSNLLLEDKSNVYIEKEISSILRVIKKSGLDCLIVSNEVGMGIVPENPLARRFRDLAGKINQLIAKASNESYFMVSGLPFKLKGEGNEQD